MYNMNGTQIPTQTAQDANFQFTQQVTPTVTSIDDLVKFSRGSIVELPPFADGQRFFARLKRPSLLGMVKRGKIPNELLVKANELFTNNSAGLDPDEDNMMTQIFDVLEIMARETFVEPAYDDMIAAGVSLTDDQLMFIFNYSQQGVKALAPFRAE